MKEAAWWQIAVVLAAYAAIYVVIGIGKGWLMRAVQMTIFLAVLLSNAYFPWTTNIYVPGIIGMAAAWVLTVVPVLIYDRFTEKLRPQPSASTDLAPAPAPAAVVVQPAQEPEDRKEYWRRKLAEGLPSRPAITEAGLGSGE